MFGFGKKKGRESSEEGHPKKNNIDNLVMGAIMGVAVGSVIGMAVAPKKGKETREIIAQKGKEAIKHGKKFLDEHKDQTKKAGKLMGFLFGQDKRENISKEETKAEMKKIPDEVN